jgi:hypothetical protein
MPRTAENGRSAFSERVDSGRSSKTDWSRTIKLSGGELQEIGVDARAAECGLSRLGDPGREHPNLLERGSDLGRGRRVLRHASGTA